MIFPARSRREIPSGGAASGTTVLSQCQARWLNGGDESWYAPLVDSLSRRSVDGLTMAEYIDIGKLPEDVREKLAELDLELSEGE
ncbi:hypothetical protein EAG_02431 [Camponotus floridanus]|uniref:DMAP1-binding domain-containing protein n=1 Tax=Camponotus floridanus TaxID=104421 RepID=E2AI18_CAMFO|nr:hypothetical protein EAG_02431 [Camponotus floridanus]